MAEEGPSYERRWALTLLFLVVTLNLIDRQVINILAQDIKIDLALSDAELGLLTGTAFGLFKALVSLPVAWLADRLDRSKMIAAMLAAWSACTMLCGLAGSFPGLFLARMGVGIGESGGQPATTALVRDYFPGRPTSALALMMAGNPFGLFLAFLAGGAIAAEWGWRWAFLLAGAPGLILSVILLATLRDPRPRPTTPARLAELWPAILAILRRPGFPLLLSATAASMVIIGSMTAWLPAFFIRAHGLETRQMGVYGAIAIGLGGGLGTLSGLMCERLRNRLVLPESIVMLLSLAAIVPLLLLVVTANDRATSLGSYVLLNYAAFIWLAPGTRLIQDAVEPHQRSLATAMCGAAGFLASSVVFIPLIGWMSDRLSSAFGPRSIGYALALALPLAVAAGWASHWALMQRLRRANLAPSAHPLS